MSAPSQRGSKLCLLFRLSFELRVMIYEHVLHHENGLDIDYDKSRDILRLRCNVDVPRSRDILPNPLSLVCRQLRNETRGLMLEANSEVNLYSTGFTTPSSYRFIRFTLFLSTVALRRLRKITISGANKAPAGALTWGNANTYFDGFKPFCAANTHTIVILRFAKVGTIDPVSWLPYCLALKRIIRDTEKVFLDGDQDTWMYYVWNQLGRALVDLLDLPPNLRFSVLPEFPEHGIKELVKKGTTVKEVHRGITCARKMWEDGI